MIKVGNAGGLVSAKLGLRPILAPFIPVAASAAWSNVEDGD